MLSALFAQCHYAECRGANKLGLFVACLDSAYFDA
jgi:hypothetical protein